MSKKSSGTLFRHGWVLVLLLTLALPIVQSQEDERPPVFDVVDADTAQVTTSNTVTYSGQTRDAVLQLNPISLSESLSATTSAADAPTALTLNLFDDVVLDATLDRTEPRSFAGQPGYMWIGEANHPLVNGEVALVIDNNAVTGSIWMPGFAYNIQPLGNGLHRVVEINLNQTAHIETIEPDDGIPIPDNTITPPPGTFSPSAADDGSTIDMLVVYTPDTLTRAGNFPNLLTQIDAAIQVMNSAFENSGVSTRTRLAATYQTNYDEAYNGNDLLLDLNRVTGFPGGPTPELQNDGFMDDVHNIRDQQGADLVMLIVDVNPFTNTGGAGVCGIAWRPGTLTQQTLPFDQYYGFGVTAYPCLTGVTLAHEAGHNMGLAHNIEDAGNNVYGGFAYGWRVPGSFRTVLSYSCTADGLALCPVVPYFSTPNRTIQGAAAGTASADNARALNETRLTVAQYRSESLAVTIQQADVNQDNRVTPADIVYVLNRLGINASADVDGNGIVNQDDATAILPFLGQSY